MAPGIVPDAGDIVWLQFHQKPEARQNEHKPAVVLSAAVYNDATGMVLCCPLTIRIKGYPFEVDIPAGAGVLGVILSDQLRSLDWRERQAEYAGKVDVGTLDEVRSKLDAVLHEEG